MAVRSPTQGGNWLMSNDGLLGRLPQVILMSLSILLSGTTQMKFFPLSYDSPQLEKVSVILLM